MKRIICLLLTVMLILGMSPSISFASTGEEEVRIVIESYFDTKSELLINNNIDKAGILSSYFFEHTKNKYLDYEIGRIQYFIESNIVSGTNFDVCDFNLEYSNIDVKGTNATIEVKVISDVKYNYMDNISISEIPHRITLQNISGNWLIIKDEYMDEFKKLFNMNTNFVNEVKKMKTNYKKSSLENIKNKGIVPPNTNCSNEKNDSYPRIVPGDATYNYLSSNRTNAVSYARLWTDNTGTNSDTNYNNNQFKYFSYGNDCQNYVSQCIWYGFGGRSSSSKDFPMYSEWWANTVSTSTTWNWTGTSYFYNEITSNYQNDGYGVQGYATTPSNIQIGDYIYVTGHVLLVTKANDTDGDGVVEYNELEICAHTSNRKDCNLSALYGAQPSDMKFMHIVKVKWNEAMKM